METYSPKHFEALNFKLRQDSVAFPHHLINNIKTWRRNTNILDFGCGTGEKTAELFLEIARKTNSKLYGLDISPSMIKFAIERNVREDNEEVLIFESGDITKDKCLVGLKFDYIFSFYTLQRIKNLREVFTKLNEIMNPGGIFSFVAVSKGFQYLMAQRIAMKPKWNQYGQKTVDDVIPKWFEIDEAINVNHYKAELEAAGFKINLVERRQQNATCTPLELAALYMSLLPFLSTIPEDLQPELLEDVRVEMIDMLKVPDNIAEVIHEVPVILLEATKI